MTTLTCPCGSRLNVRGMAPGRSGRCPRCGESVRVPGTASAPAPTIEDEWDWEGTYDLTDPPPAPPLPADAPASPSTSFDLPDVAAPPPRAPAGPTPAAVARREPPRGEPWFPPPLLFPARGLEGPMMAGSLGAAFWVMGTLAPEYCLALVADGEKIGASSMGHLVSLITAMPVLFLSPVVLVYWLQYLGRVLVNGSIGETTPPRPPDRDVDGLLGGLGSWLAWLVLGLGVGTIPLGVGLAAGTANAPILVALGLLGFPYALMALLLSFLHDEDLAARPWRVVAALARVAPSFLGLCLAMAALLAMTAVPFILAFAFRPRHFWAYIPAALPCWVLLAWAAIVAMHTLGAYHHAHSRRLRWRRPAAWWENR